MSAHAAPAGANLSDADKAMYEKLQKLETFIARRFDEISMEINATAQQLDMAEGGIASRFSEVLTVLSAVSHSGAGNTAANAGVELEAVITDTDSAATSIMDAASRIGDYVTKAQAATDEATRAEYLTGIQNEVEAIFMSCSFQDLTSQRIRKTLENIQTVEDTLNDTLEKMGIEVEVKEEQAIAKETRVTSQDDIDALFS
jgi:chemotaxis regulatin CheY-phosphate phosphatase CheZ